MSIKILKHRKTRSFIEIDGLSHDRYLSYSEKVECLKLANEKFDTDFQTLAKFAKNKKYGQYIWCYTSDFIRVEEISGVYYQYYLLQLVLKVLEKTKTNRIIISSFLPNSFISEVKKHNIIIEFDFNKFFLGRFIFIGSRLRNVFKGLKNNFIALFSLPNKAFSGSIIDINQAYNKHRFDNLERIDELFENTKYYSGQENTFENVDSKKTIAFRNELSILIFLRSILKGMFLSIIILSNSSNIPRLLRGNLTNVFNLINFYNILIFEYSVEKFFKKSSIDYVIHASTFNKPNYRVLCERAKNHGATFIQVASRTFFQTRPSEKYYDCDVLKYNNTNLPDYLILKDIYSSNIFKEGQREQLNVVFGTNKKFGTITKSNVEKPLAILLMFVIRVEQCLQMLDDIKKLLSINNQDIIFYRSHPITPIEINVVQDFFPKNKIIDLTGENMDLLKSYQLITFSAPTTGTFDLFYLDILVFWLPYLWEDSIAIDNLISNIGVICYNAKDLKSKFNYFKNSKDKVVSQIKKDQQYYQKYLKTDELISEKVKQIITNNGAKRK